jgi:predicted metal-binding protein
MFQIAFTYAVVFSQLYVMIEQMIENRNAWSLFVEKYIQRLHQLGAVSAKTIDIPSIVTAPWTIFKCQYGCGRYGKSWCCPPKSPGYQQTREILDSYRTAVLFHCHNMAIVTDIAVVVAKELFLDGYYKAIAFGSGPCKKCKECNTNGCNFPDRAAPAMEACGIDVFQTARNNGYEINTLRTPDEIQNHFGLILTE